MSWIIAGSQPFNGLARNGRSLRFTPRKIRCLGLLRARNPSTGLLAMGVRFASTPRKIRRTRITRLKPCACSPPYVHKFNININTGDGGSRTRVQNDNKRESTSLESFYLNAKSERCLQPN